MFRPKRMKRVRLIVLKSVVERLVKDLHEAGVVDIRNVVYDGLDRGRPMSSFEAISAELLKLRATLTLMESAIGRGNGESSSQDMVKIMDGATAFQEARKFSTNDDLKITTTEIAGLNDKIRILETHAMMVEKVLHFRNIDFGRLNTRTMACRVGEISNLKLPKLNEGLDGLSGYCSIISEPAHNAILVLFERKNQSTVEAILSEAGFVDIELPQGMNSPANSITKINAEISVHKARLTELKHELSGISHSKISYVRQLIKSLDVESDRSEIASRFASSKCFYIVEGWILNNEFGKLNAIAKKYGTAMEVEDVHYGHNEIPPTVLDNPKIANPMEFITNSYSLPNYFEIDPTIIYLIALPVIYGMIVGDVIYGLMSMLIAWWLMKKFKNSYIMHNVSKIWLYSAIPTIVFGLFFDEWAGLTHVHFFGLVREWTGMAIISGPLYSGFHRLENVLALVALSALVGIIHLALGFVIGAINEWSHNKKHAIGKLAWVGMEIGMVLALLPFMPGMIEGMAPISPDLTTPGVIIILISTLTLALTEGVIGIIEIPGLVGNILSYSRIAAIGVVGVIIAELLNEFLVPMPKQGVMALIMIPIFVVLHFLNCFVAMFESLIQGGRLNIVEFRSKFLHGGGDVFIPFALYSKKI